MSWVLVFLGFSALVVLHELGHFVAAKATGMRVERFFLFFPFPKLFSVKRGETEYGVGAIPLGGMVKITGMNPEEELPPEVAARGYYRQPVWKRLVVIGAGPAVNIVLAFALLFVVAFNVPDITNTIGSVVRPSPAVGAGLRHGDRIVAVDGRRLAARSPGARVEGFSNLIARHRCPMPHPVAGCRAATPVTLLVQRGGVQRKVTVFPSYDSGLGRTRIGFAWGTTPSHPSAGQASAFAWQQMWFITSRTAQVVAHIFEPKERRQLSGIVGMTAMSHEAVEASATKALFLLAMISLSLGLINLLPFLPLDGGHIFWSLVEKARGRPISLLVMERASMVGFALVAVLIVIGLSNDIGRLSGEGFHVAR